MAHWRRVGAVDVSKRSGRRWWPARFGLAIVLVTILLAAGAVAYAHWTEQLEVDAQLDNGTLSMTADVAPRASYSFNCDSDSCAPASVTDTRVLTNLGTIPSALYLKWGPAGAASCGLFDVTVTANGATIWNNANGDLCDFLALTNGVEITKLLASKHLNPGSSVTIATTVTPDPTGSWTSPLTLNLTTRTSWGQFSGTLTPTTWGWWTTGTETPFTIVMNGIHGVNVTLSGGYQDGNFPQVWDLTACDMLIRFQYDGTGLSDAASGDTVHAWAELGVRATGFGNFNPTAGNGVWLSTDYGPWGQAGTFGPDVAPNACWPTVLSEPYPAGYPSCLDLDDKLILQKQGGIGEGAYNLPGVPADPNNNSRFWWDRDGVDPFQNAETANTGGLYNIAIRLHATDATNATAYMTINGLDQGFAGLTPPAGMTWTGNMTSQQVFYGLYGYGATHTVRFNNIRVDGCLAP